MIEQTALPATIGDIHRLERRIEMLEALLLQMQRMDTTLATPPDPIADSLDLTPTARARRVALPPPDPSWIPILHVVPRSNVALPDAPPPCGKPGLYLTAPPREHEHASLEVMRILPPTETVWRRPTVMDQPRCASCLAPIDPFSNADLDYLSHMLPGRSPKTASRRGRTRSKQDRAEAATSEPAGVRSPGAPVVDTGPVSILPDHTVRAQQDALRSLVDLERLAADAGLFPGPDRGV